MTGIVELAPGDSILFISHGGTEDQDKRFLEVLKETWQRVPLADRQTILGYYNRVFNGCPIVRLGAVGGAGAAGLAKDGFMIWLDLQTILNWPRGKEDAALVIGEELAHAFLYATEHPTHKAPPPNNDRASPDFQAWDNARENAMQEVLFRWPFDRTEYEQLRTAVLEYAKKRTNSARQG
jgi:hypothetical protein